MIGRARRALGGLWAPPWTLLWVGLAAFVLVYAVQGLIIWTYIADRDRAGFEARVPLADQFAAMIEILDDAAPADRHLLLRALHEPDTQIAILPDWPTGMPPVRGLRLASGWMGEVVRGYLPAEKDAVADTIEIRYYDEPGRPRAVTQMRVLARLSDGQVLQITSTNREIARSVAIFTALAIGAIGLLLCGGLLIIVRWLTAPIAAMAGAADRLGQNIDAPPMPERGPGELRIVARAMNQLQARVRDMLSQRTRMLAGIAHDLRTVLTRQRLRAESLPDPAMRERALADFDFMLKVIDTHLNFAKSEQLQEPVTRFDLADLLRDLCEDLAPDDAPIPFAGPDSLAIVGRPAALRRALTNLIANAVAHGGAAEVELSAAEGRCAVRVLDRGPGIAVDQREAVFQPYRRLADATGVIEANGAGESAHFGLGLATARAIIRRHGGEIAIADRPGGGAAITAAWPLLAD